VAKTGIVYLVGAGPGDPGLLTLRGLECLRRADLVLYDGLVNPLLLRHTKAHAERTCRSENPSGRTLHQAEINQQLIDAARAGKTVVRLKGGDPFVFGRGSEEAAALAAAGIPFEVVPGITAAVAASAYAGISLTHRDCASAVAFVTGHEDPAKPDSALDYAALAKFPGTLVFYMGLHRLEAIIRSLLNAGKPATTPAAVISRGTTPAQRTITAELGQLAESVRRADLHPPSLIVVGDCARQREAIAWFEQRPLFGLRVAITRPSDQAGPQIDRLLDLGAQPILLPTIAVKPIDDWGDVDRTLAALSNYDWLVFTSVNGVRALLDRLWSIGGDSRRLTHIKLAAIGEATADALREFHLRPDIVPDSYRAEALAEALLPHVVGKRVLWARASRGRDVLPTELRAAGATVDELVVYQNVDIEHWDADLVALLERGEVDWICLSSPSIARNLRRLLSPAALAHVGTRIKLASISPVTSAAAREVGLPIAAEATTFTWEGLFDAILSP
jgi:uroporphyrinogen III methyltransferase/synthase